MPERNQAGRRRCTPSPSKSPFDREGEGRLKRGGRRVLESATNIAVRVEREQDESPTLAGQGSCREELTVDDRVIS
jgi:hypothetical protein